MGRQVRRAEWQLGKVLVGALLCVLVAFWPLAIIRPMWLGWVVEVIWLLGPIAGFAFWVYRVEKKPAKKHA